MLQKGLAALGFGPVASRNLAIGVITALAGWGTGERILNEHLNDKLNAVEVRCSRDLQKAKQEAYNEMKGFFMAQIEALEEVQSEQQRQHGAIGKLERQAKRIKK